MRNIHSLLIICLLLLSALCYSCANMGMPSGGPRDEDPPRFVSSNPPAGATNFHGNRVELLFNELVNVKDAFSKVTVSPPGDGTPRVSTSGRRVIVQFPDTLASATTYTIDFGNSIEDNNESNPLGAFAFSFSTGSELDSLRIAGVALDAYTLEPQQGMLIGVHPADAPDSALTTLRFLRATKTDDMGRFVIRGLKPIPYNLFALGDLNNDYRRDNPAELLAFYPTPILPHCEQAVTTDSIYNILTGAVDTVVERTYTRFLPNNLLLSVFDEGYKPQYLVKYERPDSSRLSFIFNAAAPEFPSLEIINIPDEPAMRLEYSQHRDSLTYWLSDPRLISADTLRVKLTYMQTGADKLLAERTDTLTLTKPKVRKRSGRRTKEQLRADSIAEEKAKLLGVTITPQGNMEIYQRPRIEFSEPVSRLDTTMLHLEMKQDTLWIPQPLGVLTPDTTSASRRWLLNFPPAFGETYRLTVDSLAAVSYRGRFNGEAKVMFKVKERADYASLTLRFTPDTIHGFVEVLNSGDNVVQRAPVVNGVAHFPWLAPADYYARFVADNDSNGLFTPGNYAERRQPEEVFYYPGLLSLKRHDRSEKWDLYSTPVDSQKPRAIVKNKPQSAKRRTTGEELPEEEEDDTFDVNSNPFATPSTRRR